MHMYLVVAGTLVVVLTAGFGIAGITTGWVLPLGRHRILRPKLWGYGQLVGAVGASLWMFLGVFPARLDALALIGWFVFMGGIGIQMLAQRPGRAPVPPATNSAS
ncbi:hypothetical protein [Streptomyces sp. NBC_01373]|uniref:hypothetical protein n=1 Tax=unclassified Streptomyces TaxID=2593676 RepID=UPI0022582E8F|nr:hypothetical protein [Streptomyces sp. NBC_01373]MCX4698142.1 hypothetical protein [Streptomyces sp. NBC_01373]